MPTPHDIVIVSALRTAIGSFNGALATVPAHKLGEAVLKATLDKTGIKADHVSEVILGQVLTAGQGQNPARQAMLGAGIPKEVPAMTINQVCGSGLRAVALGAQAIQSGDAEIVLAGGQENMSLAPHAIYLRAGVKFGDAKMVDTMIHDGLWEIYNNYHMGNTAENIAKQFTISRDDQDTFALASQQKAAAAQKEGKFKSEIIPITIKQKKGDVTFEQDEFIRGDTTIEALNALRPAFDKEGTVTAGNASGLNDGAAVLTLMTRQKSEALGLKPLAHIASWAHAGVDPKIMGTGPIPASKKALEKAGWKVGELDLIEANEAFAAQALCVNREMGWDTAKVNVNGGAIALGHPIGASGARVLATLLHEMQRRQAKKGLVTLCIGGGMGIAMCLGRE